MTSEVTLRDMTITLNMPLDMAEDLLPVINEVFADKKYNLYEGPAAWSNKERGWDNLDTVRVMLEVAIKRHYETRFPDSKQIKGARHESRSTLRKH